VYEKQKKVVMNNMEEIRERLQEKLFQKGIFKGKDGRHFYECTIEEIVLLCRIHLGERELFNMEDEYRI
jgi:hypothetical protein